MPLLSTFANSSARGFGFAGVGLATAPIIGSATATGNGTAQVTWNSPLSDGGSAIISYTVVPSGGAPATTFDSQGSGFYTRVVAGLTEATYYTFTVYATNSLGNSPSSGPTNQIRTFGPPDAPIIGTAAVASNTTATVSYTAPAYDGGYPITSYVAESTPSGGYGYVDQSGSGTITVSGLSQSQTYQFRVRAVQQGGAYSPYSGFSNQITMPSPFAVSVNPASGSATIPRVSTPVTSQGSFVVSAISGSGTVTVQEIERPTGGSTSISPSSFFLGNGGSRSVTVSVTSPSGFYSNNVYQYGFAILVDAGTYPTYYFYQYR